MTYTSRKIRSNYRKFRFCTFDNSIFTFSTETSIFNPPLASPFTKLQLPHIVHHLSPNVTSLRGIRRPDRERVAKIQRFAKPTILQVPACSSSSDRSSASSSDIFNCSVSRVTVLNLLPRAETRDEAALSVGSRDFLITATRPRLNYDYSLCSPVLSPSNLSRFVQDLIATGGKGSGNVYLAHELGYQSRENRAGGSLQRVLCKGKYGFLLFFLRLF